MIDIDIKVKGAIPGDSINTKLGIEKTIKILPTKEMEGFFVAKLRKMWYNSNVKISRKEVKLWQKKQ